MNKQGFKGVGNQVAGEVKEKAGKITGNASLEGEGLLQKGKGKIQSGIANLRDKANS